MKKLILSLPLLTSLIYSCSTFSNKNKQGSENTIQRPPQKINPSNQAMPVVLAKTNSSAPSKSAKLLPQDRIQEKRGNGGEVEEVKVNNINNVPPYYIYPNKSGVDSNAPSSDTVSTPNWKISW